MFEAETNVSASIKRYYSIRKNLCSKNPFTMLQYFIAFVKDSL